MDKIIKRGKDGRVMCDHNKRPQHCLLCQGYINLQWLFDICHCPGEKTKDERHNCKNCLLGSHGICIHGERKTYCKPCGGKGDLMKRGLKRLCEHGKSYCKICKLDQYMFHTQTVRINSALKEKNFKKSTFEYLGCNGEEFKKHIESQFKEGMNWDNYGKWEVDHKIPLQYNNPTIEQVEERLHWTNTQPLWKTENKQKGNRLISE